MAGVHEILDGTQHVVTIEQVSRVIVTRKKLGQGITARFPVSTIGASFAFSGKEGINFCSCLITMDARLRMRATHIDIATRFFGRVLNGFLRFFSSRECSFERATSTTGFCFTGFQSGVSTPNITRQARHFLTMVSDERVDPGEFFSCALIFVFRLFLGTYEATQFTLGLLNTLEKVPVLIRSS